MQKKLIGTGYVHRLNAMRHLRGISLLIEGKIQYIYNHLVKSIATVAFMVKKCTLINHMPACMGIFFE